MNIFSSAWEMEHPFTVAHFICDSSVCQRPWYYRFTTKSHRKLSSIGKKQLIQKSPKPGFEMLMKSILQRDTTVISINPGTSTVRQIQCCTLCLEKKNMTGLKASSVWLKVFTLQDPLRMWSWTVNKRLQGKSAHAPMAGFQDATEHHHKQLFY